MLLKTNISAPTQISIDLEKKGVDLLSPFAAHYLGGLVDNLFRKEAQTAVRNINGRKERAA